MMDLSLVLSADPWEIPDERTGEIRKGLSIWFVNSYRDSESGLKPTKVSGDVALWDQLRGRLPAVCSLSFSTRPGKENKAQLVLSSVDVIDQWDVSKVLGGADFK